MVRTFVILTALALVLPGMACHRSDCVASDIACGGWLAYLFVPEGCGVFSTGHVSTAADGSIANAGAQSPVLSGDGRYVAFSSTASNLVANDTNATSDIFLRDRLTGSMTRVSVASGGAQSTGSSTVPSASSDGRYIAFESDSTDLVAGDANGQSDIFVHDVQMNVTTRVSVDSAGAEATGPSLNAKISGNGRYVSFASAAANLVAGDTNGFSDTFLHDRQTGATSRVSVATGGAEGIGGASVGRAMSEDGTIIIMDSSATNLVTGDTNAVADAFVHVTTTGVTSRVSVATGGAESNAATSAPAISPDGRYAVFQSAATNLVSGDTNAQIDIFLHDRNSGATTRVSVATGGTQATGGGASESAINRNGLILFRSAQTDLVAGDTNGVDDIFLHNAATTTTSRISMAPDGSEANGISSAPRFSAYCPYAVYQTAATNFVAADTNGGDEIFSVSVP